TQPPVAFPSGRRRRYSSNSAGGIVVMRPRESSANARAWDGSVGIACCAFATVPPSQKQQSPGAEIAVVPGRIFGEPVFELLHVEVGEERREGQGPVLQRDEQVHHQGLHLPAKKLAIRDADPGPDRNPDAPRNQGESR